MSKTIFYRPSGQEAIEGYKPTKISVGLRKLRKCVGKVSDADFRLIVSWLVAVIYTKGPYPILLLVGENGTAKTITMKFLRMLLDPVSAPVRSLPSNEEDFFVTASNNAILAFDNISKITPKMSDMFCQVVSGVALGRRKKYTDAEEHIIKVQSAIIFNGIPDFVEKGDLADRVISIQMAVIPDEERKTIEEIEKSFESDKTAIRSAIYQAVSVAIANIETVEVDGLPRMADFARVACAVAPALGWTQEEFLEHYLDNIEEMSERCFEADDVSMAVLELMQDKGAWAGLATDLNSELTDNYSEKIDKRSWPTTASHLSGRLRMAAPGLRKKGVDIDFVRSNKKRTIVLKYNNKSMSLIK